MKIYSILALALVVGTLTTGCRSKAPEPVPPTPQPEKPEKPKEPEKPKDPKEPEQPKKPKKPYEGYEGYTLLHDTGLPVYHYNEFTGVASAPHLFLIDPSGRRTGDALADLNPDYEGHEDVCETQLSVAGNYIALLAKYDFTQHRHASRLLLLDRKTLKIQRNIRIEEPNDDNWVRQSFTLSDGSTYLAFSKKSFYRLTPEDGKLSRVSVGGNWEYPLAASSWEDKGYFFRKYDRGALQFTLGSTSSTTIEVLPAGAKFSQIYQVGGEYLVLRDDANRYTLFSMKEGTVSARFTLTEGAGRAMAYDATSRVLFFSGSGSDARERSVYRTHLTAGTPAETIQRLEAKLYYRIAGRTESDSKLGLQMTLGINTDTDQLYVSWLDQGRGGPLLHHLSKAVRLPIQHTGSLPVKSLELYDFHHATDIRDIFLNAR
jgi:hypothetical protein